MDNTKKNNNIITIILGMLVVLLSVYLVYDKVIDKADNNSNNTNTETKTEENKAETNKVVSEDIVNDLYNMLGISVSDDAYCDIFTPLLFKNGNTKDYNNELKKNIIFIYAFKHNLVYRISQLEVDGEATSGDGYYRGVREDDYYKIAKMYNISDKFENLYDKIYQNKGLWGVGNFACQEKIKNTNLKIQYEGDNIVLYDTIQIMNASDESLKETVNKKFIFNKLFDGSYALYSVESN